MRKLGIIDADLSLFGLMYFVLFEGKQFDSVDYPAITSALSATIEAYRNEPAFASHRRSPNALGNLRQRLQRSKEIYEPYAK